MTEMTLLDAVELTERVSTVSLSTPKGPDWVLVGFIASVALWYALCGVLAYIIVS